MNSKEEIKEEIKEEKVKKVRISKKVKVILVILVAVFLVISVAAGFAMKYFFDQAKGADYIEAYIQTDGETLFYVDQEKSNVFSYNPQTKELEKIIDEEVTGFNSSDDYYIFSTDKGFYYQDKNTSDKHLIIEFGKEIKERTKIIDGQEVEIFKRYESAGGREKDGFIYFTHTIMLDIKTSATGDEAWSHLYKYEIKTNELTHLDSNYAFRHFGKKIKEDKKQVEDIETEEDYGSFLISTIGIKDDRLIILSGDSLISLNLDGTDSKELCKIKGIQEIDLEREIIYSEYIEDYWAETKECYIYNLKGEKIKTFNLDIDIRLFYPFYQPETGKFIFSKDSHKEKEIIEVFELSVDEEVNIKKIADIKSELKYASVIPITVKDVTYLMMRNNRTYPKEKSIVYSLDSNGEVNKVIFDDQAVK